MKYTIFTRGAQHGRDGYPRPFHKLHFYEAVRATGGGRPFVDTVRNVKRENQSFSEPI
jgi:hypothetical protein